MLGNIYFAKKQGVGINFNLYMCNYNNNQPYNAIKYCLEQFFTLCNNNNYLSTSNPNNMVTMYQLFTNLITNVYANYCNNKNNNPEVKNQINKLTSVFNTDSNSIKIILFNGFDP